MADAVQIVRTVGGLRAHLAGWREAGETVALVPTMGAIHAGHLSLVALAKTLATHVVASIFDNPTQFGPGEDFEAYPRDEANDAEALRDAGSALLYVPSVDQMYPSGFSTSVHVSGLTDDLCGASRPGHFDGVATVVTKLLLQCAPDRAVFGEKDYQQLLVIRRIVRDLDIPVEIVGAPIVRETDGLALSSRNVYLCADERKIAPLLHRTLKNMAANLMGGQSVGDAERCGRAELETAGFAVEYLTVRDPDTLQPVYGPVKTARLLAAVRLGRTRLIDNLALPSEP